MYKYCFCLIVLLALLLTGCLGGVGQAQVSLGQEFSLSLGQSAVITEENLEIGFEEVVEDSRCPTGAVCVWEGRASCVVQITHNGSSDRTVLTEPGLTDQYTEATYKEYQISFHLTPYPEAGKEISADEYRLLLVVTR